MSHPFPCDACCHPRQPSFDALAASSFSNHLMPQYLGVRTFNLQVEADPVSASSPPLPCLEPLLCATDAAGLSPPSFLPLSGLSAETLCFFFHRRLHLRLQSPAQGQCLFCFPNPLHVQQPLPGGHRQPPCFTLHVLRCFVASASGVFPQLATELNLRPMLTYYLLVTIHSCRSPCLATAAAGWSPPARLHKRAGRVGRGRLLRRRGRGRYGQPVLLPL